MVGALISGAVGLAGTVYGAVKSGQERNRMKLMMENQKADNQAWFDQKRYSDSMQRKDTQNLMRSLRDNLQDSNRATAATAVVTGATPEQVAAQKAAQGDVITDTYANVAAQGQREKDIAESQYLARKAGLEQQEIAQAEGAAQGAEQLMGNSLSTGLSGVVGSLNNKASSEIAKKL